MFNQESPGYICPLCLLIKGINNEHVYSRQSDIFYQDKFVTAFIGTHCLPNNPGFAMVMPNPHIENIFDLPSDLSIKVHELEKQVATALKEVYKCDGISIRQHNGLPGMGQDIWHYHLQVMPRYWTDNWYRYAEHGTRTFLQPEQRAEYANKLKKYFKENKIKIT